MSYLKIPEFHGSSRPHVHSSEPVIGTRRWLSQAAWPCSLILLLFAGTQWPASAQTGTGGQSPGALQPVVVSPPKPKHATSAGADSQGVSKRARSARRAKPTTPPPQPAANEEVTQTPLNTNV